MLMKREIPWNLIVAKLKNEISATENEQLETWLSDSGNKDVFEELRTLWEKIQNNAAAYTVDKDYYWRELSRRMRLSEAVPEKRLQRKRPWWTYAAAACAVVAVALSFYTVLWEGSSSVAEAPLRYHNLSGKAVASLPDRSSVWLHTDTKVEYEASHRTNSRMVTLEGEAFFDVSPGEKPFVVQTGDVRIVVHGTKFNVESFPDMDDVYVSLLEGSISLEVPGRRTYLVPGDVAMYDKNERRLSVSKGDVAFASSWIREEMTFDQRPLKDICRFLSKWYHVKIDLSPAISDSYRYTFTLRNEPLEEILRLMARIHPIKYTFMEENEITIE